ncbi:hypothetical protein REC12_16040 [Desulfosporosinus sp. PR]|nr:hypothetical protein [Desulfosporosinus sp. PR]
MELKTLPESSLLYPRDKRLGTSFRCCLVAGLPPQIDISLKPKKFGRRTVRAGLRCGFKFEDQGVMAYKRS